MSAFTLPGHPHVVMDEPASAPTASRTPGESKLVVWGGRLLTGLPAAFLLLDGVMKLAKPTPVVEATVALGYGEGVIVPLGVVLLACTLLYLVPRTALLGAVLLTAYLGGAVASHVRVGNPLLTHTLFPVFLGVLLWGGLWLRDAGLRRLVRVRSQRA